MHTRLGVGDVIPVSRISKYELDQNEPPLQILLHYARAANVYIDALVDDELDLPARLPSPTKSEGIRRKSAARSKKR